MDNFSQDSSLIQEARVNNHSSKQNCIDLKTLSMDPDEIVRTYMQKKKKVFIINILAINFCKQTMMGCCVNLIN
jgi:hypothetical protein